MANLIVKFVLVLSVVHPNHSHTAQHSVRDEILKVHDGSDAPFVECLQSGGEVIYLQTGGRVCVR